MHPLVPPPETWTDLLLAAQAGDRIALGAFIRASQPEVWRLAAHLVSRHDADDLTQDVYLRAYRALPAHRGDASARTWLLAIARRTCVDALRRRGRRRALQARLEAQPVAMMADDAATKVELDAQLAALDADRRDAFVLTQVIGCSYDEAAAICDVAVGTIRSRVARARADLLRAMQETGS